jgi:hypothetical protein
VRKIRDRDIFKSISMGMVRFDKDGRVRRRSAPTFGNYNNNKSNKLIFV